MTNNYFEDRRNVFIFIHLKVNRNVRRNLTKCGSHALKLRSLARDGWAQSCHTNLYNNQIPPKSHISLLL